MDRSAGVESPVEQARIKAGIPLLRLEQRAGISRPTLRRKLAHPGTLTLDELSRVAAALNADAGALFAEITGGDE